MIRSFLFYSFFYVWTLFLCLGGTLFLWLPRRQLHFISKIWSWGLKYILLLFNIRVSVLYKEPISNQTFIYASKHQSAFETIMLHSFIPKGVMAMKRELFFVPFLGWICWRLGFISIDRKQTVKSLKRMVNKSKKLVEEGYSIIIFPEGTRTKPGEENPVYHRGVDVIAKRLKVNIIPIALNSGYIWPRRSWQLSSGEITVSFLQDVCPDQDNLINVISSNIEQECNRINV